MFVVVVPWPHAQAAPSESRRGSEVNPVTDLTLLIVSLTAFYAVVAVILLLKK